MGEINIQNRRQNQHTKHIHYTQTPNRDRTPGKKNNKINKQNSQNKYITTASFIVHHQLSSEKKTNAISGIRDQAHN